MAFNSWQTFATNQVVTAADLNQDIKDNLNALFPDEEAGVAWSPTITGATTNPTTSSTEGVQYRMGALQFVWVRFVISTGGAGTWTVTLPNAAVGISAASGGGHMIGSARCFDAGTVSNRRLATVQLGSTSTTAVFGLDNGLSVSGANPFTWASGDVFSFQAVYPIV